MAVMEQILNWVYDGVSKALKVSLSGSTFTKAPGATVPAEAAFLGAKYPGGTITSLNTDGQANLLVGLRNSAGQEIANTDGTLLASAARTVTVPTPVQKNYNGKGVLVFLNVTAAPAAPGTGGIIVKIRSIDPVSGLQYHINLDPALVTAVGQYGYMVYPLTSAATGPSSTIKQFISAALPLTWDCYVYHADAQPYTYSIGYSLIG